MKKSILLAVISCIFSFAYAQSDKYISAMKTNIIQLDSMMIKNNYIEIANNFTRIGDAEKTQWLPYYYAAYCIISQAYTEKDNSRKDAIANKANDLIKSAEEILGKDNSEIYVIKSMIATAHMVVDPQSRYMTYGVESNEDIAKSKALDPSNPRPVLLEAQNKFFTPEAFGGGKAVAKELFDRASNLFNSFKPETEIYPSWGRGNLQYFLAQYK